MIGVNFFLSNRGIKLYHSLVYKPKWKNIDSFSSKQMVRMVKKLTNLDRKHWIIIEAVLFLCRVCVVCRGFAGDK